VLGAGAVAVRRATELGASLGPAVALDASQPLGVTSGEACADEELSLSPVTTATYESEIDSEGSACSGRDGAQWSEAPWLERGMALDGLSSQLGDGLDEMDDATYEELRLEMEGLRQGGGASSSKVLKTLCERLSEKLDESIQQSGSPVVLRSKGSSTPTAKGSAHKAGARKGGSRKSSHKHHSRAAAR